MKKAKIAEIFFSVQGEGIYSGAKQVFLRFYGCNLSMCRFCDTRLSGYEEYSAEGLLAEVSRFREGYHSVSITGGEPLLQSDFLEAFLPELASGNKKTYLETNGTLPAALKKVIGFVDIISMDVKLPSSTGLSGFWREHESFLRIASMKNVFVKSVITAGTTGRDIEKMRDMVSDVDKTVVLVLQPVTEVNGAAGPSGRTLERFQAVCLERLNNVRIIPQLHKMAGVR